MSFVQCNYLSITGWNCHFLFEEGNSCGFKIAFYLYFASELGISEKTDYLHMLSQRIKDIKNIINFIDMSIFISANSISPIFTVKTSGMIINVCIIQKISFHLMLCVGFPSENRYNTFHLQVQAKISLPQW